MYFQKLSFVPPEYSLYPCIVPYAYVLNRAFEKKFGNFQLNNIGNTQLSKIF